jgi:hypothetical protein
MHVLIIRDYLEHLSRHSKPNGCCIQPTAWILLRVTSSPLDISKKQCLTPIAQDLLKIIAEFFSQIYKAMLMSAFESWTKLRQLVIKQEGKYSLE